MIILAILFCIGFILMCIVGFFHAMIKNRREEKALQYDSSAKYDGVYKPLYDPDTYDGIHDPEVIAVVAALLCIFVVIKYMKEFDRAMK